MTTLRLIPILLAVAIPSLDAAEPVVARVSQSVAPILEGLKPLVAKQIPDLTISVTGVPTPISVKSVSGGEAQLGGTARDLKADERSADPTLKTVPIARDGLALIVNATNPLTNLTVDQARSLLTGNITSWKELGGDAAPILIVGRIEANTMNEFLEQKFGLEHLTEGSTMAFKPKGSAAFTAVRFPVTGTHKDALAQVILKGNAFSFIPLAMAAESVKKSGKIRILTIDGVAPDADGIASGKYLLGRTLYLLTKGEPAGSVKTIVDAALSPEGQAIVAERGSYPIR